MSSVFEFFFSISSNQILGSVLNLVILGLGLSATILLWRSAQEASGEQATVNDFELALSEQADAADIVRRSEMLAPKNILRRRIVILAKLRQVGADIEPASLSALAVSELEQKGRFARWAATNVVLLGLGGTLVGLSVAVISAQPMLSSAVQQVEATNAVIATFSGLATAFSTTLMGIIWAVILGMGIGALRRRQNDYIRQIEELSLVWIYPRFRASPAEAMVNAARSLTAIQERLDSSVNEMTTELKTRGLALMKVVEDSFSDLVRETVRSGEELRSTTASTLGTVVREMRERGVALTSTVDKSFQLLTEELRDGTKELTGQLAETQTAMMRLLGDPGADATTLAENLAILQRGATALTSSAEQLHRMTPAIEEAISRQVDRQSRDIHEVLHSYTKQFSSSVQQQATTVDENLGRLESGIAKFGDVLLGQLQEHDTALLEGAAKSSEDMRAVIANAVATFAPLKAAIGVLEDTVNKLEMSGSRETETASSLKNAVSDLHGAALDLKKVVEHFPESINVTALVQPNPQTESKSESPDLRHSVLVDAGQSGTSGSIDRTVHVRIPDPPVQPPPGPEPTPFIRPAPPVSQPPQIPRKRSLFQRIFG
jgi:chromosome segregation ATPase